MAGCVGIKKYLFTIGPIIGVRVSSKVLKELCMKSLCNGLSVIRNFLMIPISNIFACKHEKFCVQLHAFNKSLFFPSFPVRSGVLCQGFLNPNEMACEMRASQ